MWLEAKGREPHTCAAEKGKAQPPCCCLLKVGIQEIVIGRRVQRTRTVEGKAALLKHVRVCITVKIREGTPQTPSSGLRHLQPLPYLVMPSGLEDCQLMSSFLLML